MSLPARGAWIEIGVGSCFAVAVAVSLPARGAWIEIWKEMQAVRSVRIEVCLYAIIDYYVTYAEEKPKGYTPHTNSGTYFGY